MKNMLRIIVTLLIIFSLVGCGAKKNDDVNNNATGNDTGTDTNLNNDDNNADNNVTNDSTTGENQNNEGNHELALADDVADKIVEMDEVESANVIVTNENAYVAVVLNEGTDDTEAIENKIADEARSANADFKNVYVSMNPDFVKQMNDYGTKIRSNEPVEGFFEEFSDSVRRVFPDAH
ncbi:YhcN/YlaJ family sporulation lipoprotein [Sporosarcina sp. JAI121]|nr:YhcN/YlaJ family sporulation lipoprotein [Sporosarcina sp. JAI121]